MTNKTETVKVASLQVGAVLTDGARITMIGPSSTQPGRLFMCGKTASGSMFTRCLPPDSLLEVDRRPNA